MDTAYINDAIEAWIAEKARRSGSQETRHKYRETISGFRTWLLQEKDRDLDLELWIAEPGDKKAWRRASASLASEAQRFAAHSRKREVVSNATYKQRIVILRSFYKFAIRRGFFEDYANPLEDVEIPHVPLNSDVHPIPLETIAAGMHSFDRSTLYGLRGFSLFATYLLTGERSTAVRNLRWRDVRLPCRLEDLAAYIQERGELCLTLHFPRTKGGKTATHTISATASMVLLEYLVRCYNVPSVLYLDGDRPLWTRLRRRYDSPITPIACESVRNMCEVHFGTTAVHRLRHTFAQELERSGMSMSDIREKMGHSSLAVTTAYLEAMHAGENAALVHLSKAFAIQ